MNPRKVADRAVARGIAWLDANVPKWREKIDASSLDLQFPCECVLGQLDGDFYKAVWQRKLSRAEVFELGFTASRGMPFRTLTAAWRRALQAGAGLSQCGPWGA